MTAPSVMQSNSDRDLMQLQCDDTVHSHDSYAIVARAASRCIHSSVLTYQCALYCRRSFVRCVHCTVQLQNDSNGSFPRADQSRNRHAHRIIRFALSSRIRALQLTLLLLSCSRRRLSAARFSRRRERAEAGHRSQSRSRSASRMESKHCDIGYI